jgi:hypothetical protein
MNEKGVIMELVSSMRQVRDNIQRLQVEVEAEPELAARLGLVHAWYVDLSASGQTSFGFSKFIGYDGLSARDYLQNYGALDGRNTEWVLREYCNELSPESRDYQILHRELTTWLARYNKTPRSKVRIMVLRRDEDQDHSTDRRLLDLLIAVSDLLPAGQRQELRQRL